MDDSYKLIKNAFIIDGLGSHPYKGSVVINDDRIYKVTTEVVDESSMLQVIDARGMYLLPGMIDCHVHVMLDGYDGLKHMATPFSLNFYNSIHSMKTLLMSGITSARDAGGADLGTKRAQAEGVIQGPDLKISISPLSITGGHFDGWMTSGMERYILNPPYPGNPSGICDGPDAVRKKVREILRCGADVIKTCSTGGVLSPTDDPEFAQFTVQELEVMVEEAAMRKGVKVMAHAQGLVGIKNALHAGVHSIEHGIYLDDEAIDLMLKKNVYLVPTLLAGHTILEGDYSLEIKEDVKAINDAHQRSMERAYKAGVKIAMGTDSGVIKHGINLKELQLMCDIGMSPMEAIVASTQVAAQCLEIDSITGTIEEEKRADLLLVKENPLENIASLSQSENIKMIIQKGRIVKQ